MKQGGATIDVACTIYAEGAPSLRLLQGRVAKPRTQLFLPSPHRSGPWTSAASAASIKSICSGAAATFGRHRMTIIMSPIDGLISQYDRELGNVEGRLQRHHEVGWANILQTWRNELSHVSDLATLKKHATRTSRSLGGMESLGEVAMVINDPELLRLIEDLYASCKLILTS